MNRRTAIKLGLLSGTLWVSGARSAKARLACDPDAQCTTCIPRQLPDSPTPQSWPRSPHIPRFEQPLRLFETLQPLKSQSKDVVKDTPPTDYFQIEMHKLNVHILPDGPPTELWVYLGVRPDGSLYPWPVIRQKGGIPAEGEIVPPDEEQRQSVVRFVNRLGKDRRGKPICTSVHLHGMASAPQYDGYAEDLIRPDYFKQYVYPNDRAATIWYHDHAISKTSRNVAMGLAGFYLVEDKSERESGLPMGKYDIPLLLQEVTLEGPTLQDGSPNPKHGQTVFNNRLKRSHYGDIPLVNGVPWPRLTVERRRYRFRLLNATASRLYQLFISTDLDGWSRDYMHVVASDCGLLSEPVAIPSGRFHTGPSNLLRIGMAERYEIVIDFSKFKAGDTVYLRNEPEPLSRDPSNRSEALMRFDVVGPKVDDSSIWPPVLPSIKPIEEEVDDLSQVTVRNWRFGLSGSKWSINGKLWDAERIDAEIQAGDYEIWELENAGGGWVHPVHIHLADFQVLSRNGLPPLPYETGWKDVFVVDEFETVRVMARFGVPRDLPDPDAGELIQGVYMMHCHNLVHEDHDMMTQFYVASPDETPCPPCGAPAKPIEEMQPF